MKTYPLRPKRNTHIWLGFPRLLSVQRANVDMPHFYGLRAMDATWISAPSGEGSVFLV
jgi:hypothetical protein